jgi:class 3 adenylate cyclase
MTETVGINVVFTDLVGSTEMSNRLGPEKTEELRVVHFGLLRGAVEAHGGTEVKNLGDGLMVVFPSLGKALDGGVAMQQAIERHNASGKEPLGVRVGIATGDATQEDGDYFGEPVVEAARLCSKCESGQIIVSQLLSMLARNSSHTFTSIGELELRGVPDPVHAMTVEWAPETKESAIALPERLVRDMRLRIAGRTHQLAALEQAFKDAEAGTRRVSMLAGEPGIGKTRLCSELAETAHEHGTLILYGRCDEEFSLPYQPWVEAIGYLIEHGPDSLVQDVVRLHGPELSLLVPQIRRSFPEVGPPATTDPETERYMLLQAITAVMGLISKDQPLLLVMDDLHWADKQTLTMLRHVFTNGASAAMIVGTYRDSDLAAGHPLIDTVAALRREPGVELIAVSGLDDDEMVELVRISAEQDLDDEMVQMAHFLRQETAGNPFFAHEILRNLVEVGDIRMGDDGRWVVTKAFEDLTLPQSVRDVVSQRIARLGEESLTALRAAAVIGKEFDLSLLAGVTDIDEDDLLDLLEAAVSAGVLAEVPGGDERFRFLHTLARNTLQEELSIGRRRRLHRKIADALEASIGANPGDRVGELATHWIAASASVDTTKAAHYARMAGKHAETALAPDEAVRWFTTALESLEDSDDTHVPVRARLLVDLGVAQRNAGDANFRQTLLDAGALARTLDDVDLMAEAATANNRGMYSKMGAVDDERIEVLRAVLDAIGPERTARRAMLLATLFSELEYAAPFEERATIIEEAREIAREVGDRHVLCAVLNRSCITTAVPHNLEERRQISAESLAIARELGDPSLEFWANCVVFQASLTSADLAGARTALDALTTDAEESAQPSLRWVAGNLTATLLAALGDVETLEPHATANFTLGAEHGEPDAFDYYAAGLMTSRWMQGRTDEIMEQILNAARDQPLIPLYRAAAADFSATNGDLEQARELLLPFKQNGFDLRVNNVWSAATGASAVAAVLIDDRDAAERLYGLLLPWAGQLLCNMAMSHRLVDSILGSLAALLGMAEEAEAHFTAAESTAAAQGMRWSSASDDLDRALACRRFGETERAVDYASRALATSQEHGYASVERRATALLEEIAH